MSFDRTITQRQYWRMASSQLSHVEFLHLVFNISALWSLGIVEQTESLGTLYYLKQTFFLFILSPIICLTLHYAAIVLLHKEEYRNVTAVGYSCVLFGWMAFLAAKKPSDITLLPVFGAISIPLILAPVCSLLLTSLLFPRASFVGHLAGILSGYIIAYVPLFELIPPWIAMVMSSFALSCFVLNFLSEYKQYLQIDDMYLFNFFSISSIASAFNAPHLMQHLDSSDIEQG